MNIKLALLLKLRQLDGHAVTSDLLLAELRLTGQIGEEEFRAALRHLDEQGMITFRVDPMTQDRRYLITVAGRNHLAGISIA